MVAVRQRRRLFAYCWWRHSAREEKPAGGADQPITAIPARVVTIRVVIHTRLTNVCYLRMRPTITSKTHKGPDVKILKAAQSSLNFPGGACEG
jgi:hypothetical protein